jgi:hypothetical protein
MREKHEDDPVAAAHPCVQVGPAITGLSSGELRRYFRARQPVDYENLDALSVVEQAAILCSILACDRAGLHVVNEDEDEPVCPDAIDLAADVMLACPLRIGSLGGFAECWAEASSRLFNGEVTP